MNTSPDRSTTIPFRDHAEDSEGLAVVRRIGDKVAVCLSTRMNGDVEVLLERQVVDKLIEALERAVE